MYKSDGELEFEILADHGSTENFRKYPTFDGVSSKAKAKKKIRLL